MREPLLPTLTGVNKTPLNKPTGAPNKTNATALLQASQPKSSALSNSSTANASAWMTAQIRQHLPQAQPLTPTLDRWANQLSSATVPLDAKQQLVAAFIDRLVTAKDLTQPQQLSAAIQNSGIWLEAQVAQAIANPNQFTELAQDLKGQLLSLAEQLSVIESTSAPTESVAPPESTSPEIDSVMAMTVEAEAPAEAEADTDSTTEESDDAESTLETDDDERIDDDQDTEIKMETGAESNAESDSEAETNSNADAPSDANDMPDEAELAAEDIDLETLKSSSLLTTETTTRSAARLAHSKRPPSDRLIHDIDGMIKHVVTQQLHSLNSDGAQPYWLLELPFRMPNGAVLMLNAEIEREQRGTRVEDERWNMRLKLNLPRLGSLSINLSLRMERLNAGLQAGTEAGAALIRDHLEILRQQLANQHLDIASLYAGYRPQVNAPTPLSAPKLPMIQEQG
ncbi:hypothetical protein CKO09_05825 [Chromatium weissei]|nr:hypothetical protein [Chromatium weissei]